MKREVEKVLLVTTRVLVKARSTEDMKRLIASDLMPGLYIDVAGYDVGIGSFSMKAIGGAGVVVERKKSKRAAKSSA